MNFQTLVLDIDGMTCSTCSNGVQRAVGKLDGVGAVVVALKSRSAAVQTDPCRVSPLQIEQAIEKLGFTARVRPALHEEH